MAKVDRVKTDFARALGHYLGEGALVAGDSLRQHDAGIVTALDDRAVQEIVDRNLAVERGKHGRAAGRRAAFAPGILADAVLVGQLDVALLDGVEDHFRRHQLHHAGGRAQFVGVFLEEYRAAGGFDQDRGRRIAVEPALFLLGALHAVVGGVEHAAPSERDERAQRRSGRASGALS